MNYLADHEEKMEAEFQAAKTERDNLKKMLLSVCNNLDAMNLTSILTSDPDVRAWWMANREQVVLEKEDAMKKANIIKGVLDKLDYEEKVALGLVWE